jgi:DMSO/TMAO reductase YedYZ molybdopterin-dependent catalytic subunit
MRKFSRREVIALGATGIVVAAAGGAARFFAQPTPGLAVVNNPKDVAQPQATVGRYNYPASSLPLPLWITPNEDFYVVQYDQLPSVSLTSYSLWVYGLVRNELHLTYDQVRALPAETRMHTLECIGNPAGGNLIGNAEWRGVPFRALLEQAGIDPKAKYVLIGGIDEYLTSVPIERALHEEALLAYEMNGQPLPLDHGYPLRVILPGVYGQKQPKWVTGIGVMELEELGPWELKGWSSEATIQLNSAIKIPREGTSVAHGDILLAGVAYASDIGIRMVQVSLDSGKTWNESILTRGSTPCVWTQWGYQLHDVQPGKYNLMVRAIDDRGNIQNQQASGILSGVFPNGTSEVHSMELLVRD